MKSTQNLQKHASKGGTGERARPSEIASARASRPVERSRERDPSLPPVSAIGDDVDMAATAIKIEPPPSDDGNITEDEEHGLVTRKQKREYKLWRAKEDREDVEITGTEIATPLTRPSPTSYFSQNVSRDEAICGNCVTAGHCLNLCPRPNARGGLNGCPWCNTTEHNLYHCPAEVEWDLETLWFMLVKCRHGLCQILSPWKEIRGETWKKKPFRPQTEEFTMQLQSQNIQDWELQRIDLAWLTVNEHGLNPAVGPQYDTTVPRNKNLPLPWNRGPATDQEWADYIAGRLEAPPKSERASLRNPDGVRKDRKKSKKDKARKKRGQERAASGADAGKDQSETKEPEKTTPAPPSKNDSRPNESRDRRDRSRRDNGRRRGRFERSRSPRREPSRRPSPRRGREGWQPDPNRRGHRQFSPGSRSPPPRALGRPRNRSPPRNQNGPRDKRAVDWQSAMFEEMENAHTTGELEKYSKKQFMAYMMLKGDDRKRSREDSEERPGSAIQPYKKPKGNDKDPKMDY